MASTVVLEPEIESCQSLATPYDQNEVRRVMDALVATGRFSQFRVSASVRNGHVALDGEVTSYYLKQIAQTAVLALDGIKSLDNRLFVFERRFASRRG